MEKQVEFKVDNDTLRGSLFIPPGKGSFPGVVFFHGRGSSRKRYLEIARRLSEKGQITLAFDFRGCGKSDGIFEKQTQRMGIDDARAGLKYLLDQNVDNKRIGIVGTSFGGFVSAILMKDYGQSIKSLLLRAPAIYPDELLDTHVSSIEDFDSIKKEKWLDSIAYDGIADFKGNLFIIQSEKDKVVKSWVVENYFNRAINAQNKELFVQIGAEHSLLDDKKLLEQFYKLIYDWFLETL